MPSRPRPSALALLAPLALLASCDAKKEAPRAAPPAPTAATATASAASAAPADSRPVPARRGELSAPQLSRIRALHASLAEVDDTPLEKWIDDFKRDDNAEHELAVYEAIASGYASYCKGRALKREAKVEVYKLLVFRSTASEQEVLAQAPIEALTKAQAAEVLKGYRAPF